MILSRLVGARMVALAQPEPLRVIEKGPGLGSSPQTAPPGMQSPGPWWWLGGLVVGTLLLLLGTVGLPPSRTYSAHGVEAVHLLTANLPVIHTSSGVGK